jgi:hypothetical protein
MFYKINLVIACCLIVSIATWLTTSQQPVSAQTSGVKFSFTLLLHGIGVGGDNANANSGGNKNPVTTNRNLQVELYNASDQPVSTKRGTIIYNPTGGNFTGVIDMGAVANGTYQVKVKSDQYLRKAIPGIITVTTGQTVQVPQAALVVGDGNGDNKINVLDYNFMLDCFSDLAPAKNCADANKKKMTDFSDDGAVNQVDYNLLLREISVQVGDGGEISPSSAPQPTAIPTMQMGGAPGESMAMHFWGPGGKNVPNPQYDKCDDGTDVVAAHNQYYVIAYDGIKYPTWHPDVVVNPITGVGKCYFGHEHGSNPQKYIHWDDIVQHFGKDINNDGKITAMVIGDDGKITPNDRAGIPFAIANEHMDAYYNKEGRDSIFVRHEDHVGHKIEFVNQESDVNTTIDGNVTKSTDQMAQLPGTRGLNVPYYSTTGAKTYKPTGVVCSHLHKFHQGTHSGDAIRNNLHEVIFHSTCTSVDVDGINAPAYYPDNTVILTGMMAFGNPGEYQRFCFADRTTKVCPDGKAANGSCIINDPLLSKMPDAIHSDTLGRNMVDRYCLEHFAQLNPGTDFFGPYELWQGDLRIQKANGTMLAEHGRQWDVLDPVRFIDPNTASGFSYNSLQCAPGGAFDGITFIGGCASRSKNIPWDSPQSGFRGLKRTTYFGRNRVSNAGGPQIWWTDPLGGNAAAVEFASGLKQKISPVEADIQKVQSRVQQLFGANNFLNDRAIQRQFNDGGGTVHAPN